MRVSVPFAKGTTSLRAGDLRLILHGERFSPLREGDNIIAIPGLLEVQAGTGFSPLREGDNIIARARTANRSRP